MLKILLNFPTFEILECLYDFAWKHYHEDPSCLNNLLVFFLDHNKLLGFGCLKKKEKKKRRPLIDHKDFLLLCLIHCETSIHRLLLKYLILFKIKMKI